VRCFRNRRVERPISQRQHVSDNQRGRKYSSYSRIWGKLSKASIRGIIGLFLESCAVIYGVGAVVPLLKPVYELSFNQAFSHPV
jgi:hypothetical protein